MAEDYRDLYKTRAGDVATGALSGGVKGAGTGAQLGTLIMPGPGTAIGAAVGALGGAIAGGAGARRPVTAYEKENLKRLNELQRQMELGQLGLTPEEKAAIFGQAELRESKARAEARAQRDRMMESFAAGSGVAAAQAAQAEESAIKQMRETGVEVAKADIARAREQEQEYWARLAAASMREAEEKEKSQERRQQLFEDVNEFLTSEITTSGPGKPLVDREADALKRMSEQFGTDNESILKSVRALQANPGLFDLLVTAGG